jgi:hypothetical protein
MKYKMKRLSALGLICCAIKLQVKVGNIGREKNYNKFRHLHVHSKNDKRERAGMTKHP